jgi:hypothetical protein
MNIKRAATLWGWPLIVVPIVMSYFGGAMNEVAVWKNGGQMPVYSEAYKQHIEYQLLHAEYDISQGAMPEEIDPIHKAANKDTKVPFLCDWILSDASVMSPGDIIQDVAGDISGLLRWTWAALFAICLWTERKSHL